MGYKYNIQDILDVGYDVLRKNGYHNTGLSDILNEAGIPKGSFYNFFDSKEDFVNKVIKRYGESNAEWMRSFFYESKLSPVESLKSFYKLLIDINEKDEFLSGCIVNNMSIEMGRINDVMATNTNEQFNGWLNVIASVVDQGQKLKEITNRFSAFEIAEYLHAGFYGTFSRMKVTRNRKYMDVWYDMSFEFIET